ncbi:MAG TPA: RusA family crossover junction endodeoxyribonuclease [Puia sp.]|jgi:crossover junction endodeoxyribonuclease RusA|nr:RusA family crossover junction endodeoxyribonuclease [Puia sp.]
MILELELPYPPSVNHYKKAGRIVKTAAGKLYQQRVNTDETKTFYFQVYILTKKLIPAEWPKSCDKATFSLKIYVYPPDGKKRDLDNILKVLIDSLVRAHIIKDDSQVCRLYVEKCDIIKNGKVLVRIEEVE